MSAADDLEPIHMWFELTYSSYLVLHRSLLQSMPREWQVKFVGLLEEMEDSFDCSDVPTSFTVKAKKNGKFVHDPYADYQRGRRVVPLKRSSS